MPRGSAPGERRGGRTSGTPNKFNADLKNMILGALNDAGGQAYLAARAIDTPGPFLALIGKVLPMQLTGEPGAKVGFVMLGMPEIIDADEWVRQCKPKQLAQS